MIFYMQISTLKIDSKIFDGYGQAFPKFPKKGILQCLYNIPKKVVTEVDFFDADKHQSFITVDFNTLDIYNDFDNLQSFLQWDRHDHENVKGMVMGMMKHSQSTQSNKFAMSLQYF